MLKKLYKMAKVSLLIVIWLIVFLTGTDYFISSKFISDKISGGITEITRRQSSAGTLSGNLISNLAVKNIDIRTRDGSSSATSVGSISASYSLLSILKGKFRINEINFSDGLINIKRNANNAFDFEDALAGIGEYIAKPASFKAPIDLAVSKINLQNFKINFSDAVNSQMDHSSVGISSLKIKPQANFMIFEIEGYASLLQNDEIIAPKIRLKANVNVIRQTFKLSVETDKISLKKLNYVLSYFVPALKVEKGFFETSSIINYMPGKIEIFGKANVRDLAVKHSALPFPIVASSINFDFDENMVRLYGTRAGIPGFEVKMEGAFSNLLDPAGFAFMLKTTLTDTPFEQFFSPLKTYFNNALLSSYYSSGRIDLALCASGMGTDYTKWDIAAILGLKKVGLISRKVPVTLKELNGKIELAKGNVKILEELTFNLSGSPFEIKGYLRNVHSPVFDFSLKSKAADIGAAAEAISAAASSETFKNNGDFKTIKEDMPKLSGNVGLSARICGSATRYYYSAAMNIRNVVMRDLWGIPEAAISANLTVRNNQFTAKNIIISVENALLTGALNCIGLDGNGRISVTANASGIDLTKLKKIIAGISSVEISGIVDASVNLAGKYNALNGNVKAALKEGAYAQKTSNGSILKIPIENLGINGKINKNKISARYDGCMLAGKIYGDAKFDFCGGKPSFSTSINAEKLNIEEFLTLNGIARLAGGALNLKGLLTGNFEDILTSAAGNGTFSIAGAKIYGESFFGKVLKDLPEYNEMQFERADGNYNIENGNIKAQNVIMENALFKLATPLTVIGMKDLALSSLSSFTAASGFSAEIKAAGTLLKPDLTPTVTCFTAAVKEKIEAEKTKLVSEISSAAHEKASEIKAAAAGELSKQTDGAEKIMETKAADMLKKLIK